MAVFAPSYPSFTEPYKFSVFRNSGWTPSSGSFAKVQFDSKNFDTGSNFDAVTNFRFTTPIAGFYWFAAAVSVSAGSSNNAISLFKNTSTEILRGTETSSNAGSTGYVVSGILQLAVNDTIEVQFFGGATQTGGTGSALTYFDGFLLSST